MEETDLRNGLEQPKSIGEKDFATWNLELEELRLGLIDSEPENLVDDDEPFDTSSLEMDSTDSGYDSGYESTSSSSSSSSNRVFGFGCQNQNEHLSPMKDNFPANTELSLSSPSPTPQSPSMTDYSSDIDMNIASDPTSDDNQMEMTVPGTSSPQPLPPPSFFNNPPYSSPSPTNWFNFDNHCGNYGGGDQDKITFLSISLNHSFDSKYIGSPNHNFSNKESGTEGIDYYLNLELLSEKESERVSPLSDNSPHQSSGEVPNDYEQHRRDSYDNDSNTYYPKNSSDSPGLFESDLFNFDEPPLNLDINSSIHSDTSSSLTNYPIIDDNNEAVLEASVSSPQSRKSKSKSTRSVVRRNSKSNRGSPNKVVESMSDQKRSDIVSTFYLERFYFLDEVFASSTRLGQDQKLTVRYEEQLTPGVWESLTKDVQVKLDNKEKKEKFRVIVGRSPLNLMVYQILRDFKLVIVNLKDGSETASDIIRFTKRRGEQSKKEMTYEEKKEEKKRRNEKREEEKKRKKDK